MLHHAAGDQLASASIVGSGSLPSYDPFAPPHRLDRGVVEVVQAAVEAATKAWAGVDPAATSVPTPLPPVPVMEPALAAAACALDAAVHAWDVAVATASPTLRPCPPSPATTWSRPCFATSVATLLRYLGRDPEYTA